MGNAVRPVVLFVHGVHTLGGDSMALLRTIEHYDQSALEALAVAPPDSEGYKRLQVLASRGPGAALPSGFRHPGCGRSTRSRLLQPLKMAGALIGLLRIVAQHRVDVVYTLDRSRAVALAAAPGALLHRRLVVHAHNPWSRWGNLAGRRADCIVAVS